MPHSEELDALATSLGRPIDSLHSLSTLDSAQLAALREAIEHAVRERHEQLDQSLNRILPWPLRGPLLSLLRRA